MNKKKIWEAKDRLGLGISHPNENFENWGKLLANIGQASPEEVGVASAGLLIECFRGWQFQLPSDEEVEKVNKFGLQIIPWSEDNLDEIILWDGDEKNIPDVLKRFIKDILEES